MNKKSTFILAAFITVLILQCGAQTSDYPVRPVPFTSVQVTDSFWAPRILTHHEVTVPYVLDRSSDYIDNLYRAAGLMGGGYTGYAPFDDGFLFMMLVGASRSLQHFDDPEFEAELDSLITIIGMAQEEDGYLYTYRQIEGDNSHPWVGPERWALVHELSHELYDMAFLIEAGVAHYEATGKSRFLDIAIKAADCIDDAFGWGKIEDYPGHQAVEFALVKLYRATGEQRYLDLAKFFLDVRGPDGEQYCQAHQAVVDQEEAVGHSVRAVFMYAGMADVAAITSDHDYIHAIDKIWEDIVHRKIYITGGIGATGGNEGFDAPYVLPNSSAYCETCASIANVMFNHRMFMLHGESKYADVMERSLYNSLLCGISLSGDRFHYANPLASSGSHSRYEWHVCPCCAANLTRFIPSIPGMVYATKSDSLYINLFVNSTSGIDLDGTPVSVEQSTAYPWEGDVEIKVNPESPRSFKVLLRVPGWAGNIAMPGGLYRFMDETEDSAEVKVNGVDATYTIDKGYIVIDRNWQPGDVISYSLPMKVRRILSDERIVYNRERISLQRGPLVYCFEEIDNPDLGSEDFRFDQEAEITTLFNPDSLEGTQELYCPVETRSGTQKQLTLIPYHLWNNRQRGKMEVWLSTKEFKPLPDSLILIDVQAGDFATTNYVSPWEDLDAIYDLYDPASSGDKGPAAFGNWMSNGGTVGVWNWVQYNFNRKYWVCASDVYWWDDNAGITLPDQTYLSYWDSASSAFIEIPGTRGSQADGTIQWDQYNSKSFTPVYTDKVRLNFLGNSKAQGILEWMLYFTDGGSTGSLDAVNAGSGIRIYPSITGDCFTIDLGLVAHCEMQIFNASGSLVEARKLNGNQLIYRGIFENPGLYLIRFSDGLNHYATEKLLILN